MIYNSQIVATYLSKQESQIYKIYWFSGLSPHLKYYSCHWFLYYKLFYQSYMYLVPPVTILWELPIFPFLIVPFLERNSCGLERYLEQNCVLPGSYELLCLWNQIKLLQRALASHVPRAYLFFNHLAHQLSCHMTS